MSDETIMSAGTPTPPAERPPRFALNMRWRLASEAIWFVLALVLAIVLFVLNLLIADANPRILSTIFRQALPIALLLPPTVLLMASGGLDLSVVGVSALAAAIVGQAVEGGAPFLAGEVVALVVALVVGLLHGLLVSLARINGIIVTLGTGAALQVLAVAGAGRTPVGSGVPMFGEGGGSALLWLIALLVIGITALLLYLTPFGRRPQPDDEQQEGRLARLLFVGSPYVFSSLMAALAGIAIFGALGIAFPGATASLSINTLLAALIAGTPFGLGYGNVIAGIPALFAATLFSVTANILQVMTDAQVGYLPGLAVVVFVLLAHLFAYGGRALYARRSGQMEPAVPDEE